MSKAVTTRLEDDFAICPWCDSRHDNTFEMEDGICECWSCGKQFELSSYTIRVCTTKRIEQVED